MGEIIERRSDGTFIGRSPSGQFQETAKPATQVEVNGEGVERSSEPEQPLLHILDQHDPADKVRQVEQEATER